MQTWKTLNVPPNWLEATRSLQESLHGTDFSYIFLTDYELNDFVAHEYPTLLALFLALPYGVQRADIGRYLWLYKFGGLYIDMDFLVLRPFVDYLDSLKADLLLVHSSNLKIILTNSFIYARPKLDLLYDLAKEGLERPYGAWWAFSKHMHIMSSTGPLAFHNKIVKSQNTYASLPNSLFLNFSPVSLSASEVNQAGKMAPMPFMVPVEGASWNSLDTMCLNFINSFKWTLLSMIIAYIAYALIDFGLLKLNVKYFLSSLKKRMLDAKTRSKDFEQLRNELYDILHND